VSNDLPHDWQDRLNKAIEEGRLRGGLECCGTRGLEHRPYCRAGIPSNTQTIHAFFGLPEPVKEETTVPLVIYRDNGDRVVLGSATLHEDGTATMEVKDKKFLKEQFDAMGPLSIGLKLQEFSIAASIDNPPVIKWTMEETNRVPEDEGRRGQ
jgi:hypothetical protein